MAKHSVMIEAKWRDDSPTVWFSVALCGVEEASGVTNFEPPECSNLSSALALLWWISQMLTTAEPSP